MLGRHVFSVGDRVRFSAEGIAANLGWPKHNAALGTVVKVDEFNAPSVRWDHRKTASRYHPDFIEPVDA
jgi:hypothetical protein